MLLAEGVGGEELLYLLTRGKHAVLIPRAFDALLVAPEQGALVRAVDAVQRGDRPGLDFIIGVGTAAGMEIHRVVPQRKLQIICTGGADRADLAYALQALVDAQHSGDSSLRQHLIDNIGLGDAVLGQRGL
ncbi:hypothetical protein SDC9_198637 [bioreactor metagenome]|uniref:Uncharacterized protein n=1 Tax=bioreactor metagenome TaxID=1076179 RepID=A0A645IJ31_9ZZZZ